MVAPSPFLNPGTVDLIHTLQQRGFATQQAVRGIAVTFYRAQVVVGTVMVVPTYADRGQIDTGRSGLGAIAPTDSGTFRGPADWEVKEGDSFMLDGARGRITDVAPFIDAGSRLTVFRMDDRGVPNGQ